VRMVGEAGSQYESQGSDHVDRGQDRLHARDVASPGTPAGE
jgi:hypothetical protein